MMRHLSIIAIALSLAFVPTVSKSAHHKVSTAIDKFVSQVYPKGSRYFWVINDTTSDLSNEIILDINTSLQITENGDAKPKRFLLLFIKGKHVGTQHIPLEAEVDCHSDEKEI